MLNNVHLPNRTVIQCGVAALLSLLLMSWLRIRPLGVIFLGIFGFWIYQTRCNLRIVAPPELQKKYETIVERVRTWRQNQPAMFCAVTSIALAALAVLGHYISGSTVVLIGLVLAAIVSTKYNFKVIKVEPKDFEWSRKLQLQPDLDEEFMPDVDESNLFVLERASELATISSPTEVEGEDEEKSDEIPSELLIPDVIPEINENTTDEDDDDELLVPISKKEQPTIAQTATISESSYHITQTANNNNTTANPTADVIQFRKRHFKRDSSLSNTSSSSEESLSKGLQFPDHTQVDAPSSTARLREITDGGGDSMPYNQSGVANEIVAMAVKTQTQALLANSGKLLPSLMTGLVQWGMGGGTSTVASNDASSNVCVKAMPASSSNQRVVTALDSSDESDFEILESDDFN